MRSRDDWWGLLLASQSGCTPSFWVLYFYVYVLVSRSGTSEAEQGVLQAEICVASGQWATIRRRKSSSFVRGSRIEHPTNPRVASSTHTVPNNAQSTHTPAAATQKPFQKQRHAEHNGGRVDLQLLCSMYVVVKVSSIRLLRRHNQVN